MAKAEILRFMPSPEDVAAGFLTMSKTNIMGLHFSTAVMCALVCEKVNDVDAAMVRPEGPALKTLPTLTFTS